jgi:hypothetical protein
VEDHGQGWRLRHRVRRAFGAPLSVILRGSTLGRREDATSSPGRAASTGGGRRAPGRGGRGWVRCVRRLRCGPSGPKAVGGAPARRVSPALARARAGGQLRRGRGAVRAAPSVGRRRPGPGARSAPLKP